MGNGIAGKAQQTATNESTLDAGNITFNQEGASSSMIQSSDATPATMSRRGGAAADHRSQPSAAATAAYTERRITQRKGSKKPRKH